MDWDLSGWVGEHETTWRTYLRPGKLHDESDLHLTIGRHGDGYRIDYRGAIADEAVTGSMVIPDPSTHTIEWTDSWHTAGVTERLQGPDPETPPSYRYGPDDERWTWSIDIEVSTRQLAITHYNAPPDGEPAVAVEIAVP